MIQASNNPSSCSSTSVDGTPFSQFIEEQIESQTSQNYTQKGGYDGTTQDLKDEFDNAVFTGAKTYQTLAEFNAVSPVPEDGTPFIIANDPNEDNNGKWSVSGGVAVQNSRTTSLEVEQSNNSKGVVGQGIYNFTVPKTAKWLDSIDSTPTNLELKGVEIIKDVAIDFFSLNTGNTNLQNGTWFISVLTRNDPTYGDRIIVRCKVNTTTYTFSDIQPSGTYNDVQEVTLTANGTTIVIKLDFRNYDLGSTLIISTSTTPKFIIKNTLEEERINSEVNRFNLIASKSASGFITLENNLLSWKNVIFFMGNYKYVYINDLTNTGQSGSGETNSIDLSTLSNTTYLYIDLDDFLDLQTANNINIKTASWLNTYIPKNIYIIGYVQTVGEESSYSGKLFDLWRNEKITELEQSKNIPFENNINLQNFNYKKASINNGNNESIVIGLHGDSWTHMTNTFSRYTTFIARYLRNKYGNGGGGWYDFAASTGGNFMYSIDEDDANDTRTGTINYIDEGVNSLGINCAYVEMTSSSTITLNVTSAHEKFVIHYIGNAAYGTWRYRIDGGTWNNIDSSSTTGYQTIDEVVSDATHTIEFECLTGTVVVLGVDMQRTYGVRVHKFGNRGLRAADVLQADEDLWKDALQAFNLDCFTTLLGTNEKTIGTTPTSFKSQMQEIYDLVTDVNPYVDFCFISPSNNRTTNTYEMVEYQNKLYELSVSNNCAYISLIPVFGSIAKLTDKGFFYDSVHPTIEGGKAIQEYITSKIFE